MNITMTLLVAAQAGMGGSWSKVFKGENKVDHLLELKICFSCYLFFVFGPRWHNEHSV